MKIYRLLYVYLFMGFFISHIDAANKKSSSSSSSSAGSTQALAQQSNSSSSSSSSAHAAAKDVAHASSKKSSSSSSAYAHRATADTSASLTPLIGLEDNDSRKVTTIVSKGKEMPFLETLLMYSGVFRAAIEKDKEVKEIPFEQMTISLEALHNLLQALHDNKSAEELRELISKSDPISVLETANYLDIQGLFEPASQTIADEFVQRYQKNEEWLDRLKKLPGDLQSMITSRVFFKFDCLRNYILPYMLDGITIIQSDWGILRAGDAQKIAISPNGRLLARLIKNNLEIWDLQTNKLVCDLKKCFIEGKILKLVWSPDNENIGMLIAHGRSSSYKAYNIYSKKENFEIKEFNGNPFWVAPNQIYAVCDGIKVFDGLSGELIDRTFFEGSDIAVTSSKVHLLTGRNSPETVSTIYKLFLRKHFDLKVRLCNVAFSPNGQLLSGKIFPGRMDGPSTAMMIFDELGNLISKTDHYHETMSWLPNNSMIAFFWCNSIRIWDVYTNRLIAVVSKDDFQLCRHVHSNEGKETFLWSPDNTIVFFGYDRNVAFCDFNKLAEKQLKKNPLSIEQFIVILKKCKKQILEENEEDVVKRLSVFWTNIYERYNVTVTQQMTHNLIKQIKELIEKQRALNAIDPETLRDLTDDQRKELDQNIKKRSVDYEILQDAIEQIKTQLKEVAPAIKIVEDDYGVIDYDKITKLYKLTSYAYTQDFNDINSSSSSSSSAARPAQVPTKKDIQENQWLEWHALIALELKQAKEITQNNLQTWIQRIKGFNRKRFNINARNKEGKTLLKLFEARNKQDDLGKRYPDQWKELTDLLK